MAAEGGTKNPPRLMIYLRGFRCFSAATVAGRPVSIVMRLLLGLAIALWTAVASFAADARPRLIVLTDMGGDPDDQQSMIRLMLYANEFDIEGLIATASGTPGELKDK